MLQILPDAIVYALEVIGWGFPVELENVTSLFSQDAGRGIGAEPGLVCAINNAGARVDGKLRPRPVP
jgi:hypothetical protein